MPLQGLWGWQRVPVGECAMRGAGRSQLCVFSLIASPPTPWISVSSSVKWGMQSLSCILHGAILRIMKTKGFGMMMEMRLTLFLAQGGTSSVPSFFFLIFIFIYLFGCLGLSWGIWDLVPWPRTKPGPPVLGVQRLSCYTTREVPVPGCVEVLPAQACLPPWGNVMPEDVRLNLVFIPEPPGITCLLQSQRSPAGIPRLISAFLLLLLLHDPLLVESLFNVELLYMLITSNLHWKNCHSFNSYLIIRITTLLNYLGFSGGRRR